MTKRILLALWACFCLQIMIAQTMSDEQVMRYIVKQHEAGTSQAQIVTKLMQRGVDIAQIRRVKTKFERQAKQSGMGNLGDDTSKDNGKRQRTNNGKTRSDYGKQANKKANGVTSNRIKSIPDKSYKHTYDEDDEEFMDFQNEMMEIIPDTATLLKQLMDERDKEQKKVFGHDIFNNQELTFEPNMNIATPQDYRIGPGDEVIIDVYGASQKTEHCTVSPDGEVIVEGFGPIQVSGLTVAQANARVRSTLGSRYSSSQVKLTIGQTRTIMVNVMGEVLTPGTYTLSAFSTVFHALYMAGGINEIGTLRNIKVYRNNALLTSVDIYDYILNGKLTGNVRLADNDVIVVEPYDCLVNITGRIKRPMYYEMKSSESVASLLKYAGSFTGDAYKKAVRVNRKSGREYAAFNVEEFDFSTFNVMDGDSVTVDSILPRYANTVEVKGAVFRPGFYNLGAQVNSVRTLIEHADGLLETAFPHRGIIHRMKDDRTLEMVSVDLAGVLNGTVADVPLKENDVLFVATRTDVTTERTITIRGEVQFPGTYKYAENETVEDFVLQAGGLTDKASLVNVTVSRRVSNPKAIYPDSLISKTFTLSLKDDLKVDGDRSFTLMPFDEVYIMRSPAYMEQQNVSIEGEVMFAGTYSLTHNNTRLSDLFKRAGGGNHMAYIKGARLMRKTNEVEKARMRAVLLMQREQQQKNLLELAASTSNASNIQSVAEDAKDTNLEKFNIMEEYPVGIDLEEALLHPGSDVDLILREGDRLIVPQYNGTVKINGAVMFANTVAYEKDKKASHYINLAGGYAADAVKKNGYIVYMNGKVSKIKRSAKIMPGCEIVIPAKLKRKMSTAETMSMGASMSSFAAVLATIANILK